MDPEVNTIHIHEEHSFDKSKIFILMIPALVFLVVLATYITVTSYQSHSQTAAISTFSPVLGTSQ